MSSRVVGIDARAAADVPAGRGRVIRELLGALAARSDDVEFRLYSRRPWRAALDHRFKWELISARDPVWHVNVARRASRACDCFLSMNSYLTAWFVTVPCAVVVYDLVAWRPDASPQRRAARIERLTAGLAVRRARQLLCISESTRRDLTARFPRAAGRARVLPLAASPRFTIAPDRAAIEAVRLRHRLPERFVLTAGTLEPRKNLTRLISAYAGLPASVRDRHTLAVVGPAGWELDAILASAAARSDDVRLLGHLPDDELAALYSACTVFAYPSLYEGFGLPLLEAMAAGAACLASNSSSLPEVGGDAILYADPRDVDSLRAGLARLLGSEGERRALSLRARARASEFSWEHTAEVLMADVEDLSRAGGPCASG